MQAFRPWGGWALRPAGRWPDLSSAALTAPDGPGDTTLQIMSSTRVDSHAGPAGQWSRCGATQNITGGTSRPHSGWGRLAARPDALVPLFEVPRHLQHQDHLVAAQVLHDAA